MKDVKPSRRYYVSICRTSAHSRWVDTTGHKENNGEGLTVVDLAVGKPEENEEQKDLASFHTTLDLINVVTVIIQPPGSGATIGCNNSFWPGSGSEGG